MTDQAKPCICGADDYNDHLGMDWSPMPHALNCPSAPGYVAPVSLPSADQEWDKPEPASVTPASDEEVKEFADGWDCDCSGYRIQDKNELLRKKISARIKADAKVIAELREEGLKLKTAIDDLKRTVTEASMRRHEEIAALRSELAVIKAQQINQGRLGKVGRGDAMTDQAKPSSNGGTVWPRRAVQREGGPMSSQTPASNCLPGCHPSIKDGHAYACPNAEAPKAEPAPRKFVDLGMGVPVEIVPTPKLAPGYVAPASLPSADQEWDKPAPKCAICSREESWHRGSMHGFKPAPTTAPGKVPCCCEPDSEGNHDPDCPTELEFKPAPTPAPASVTPASDEAIAAWKKIAVDGRRFIPADVVDRLIARIEADAKVIAELREGVERQKAMTATGFRILKERMKTLHERTAEVEKLEQDNHRLDGEVCSAAAQLHTLRARLAEVSEAASVVCEEVNGTESQLRSVIEDLRFTLAKGDK